MHTRLRFAIRFAQTQRVIEVKVRLVRPAISCSTSVDGSGREELEEGSFVFGRAGRGGRVERQEEIVNDWVDT